MVTRHDVNKVKKASNKAYRLARQELDELWLKLPFDKPEACREILLRAVPALVERHGKVAAVAALQWYTELREDASGLPAYTPVIPASTPLPQALVRAELGGLWEQDEKKHSAARDRVLDALDGMVERAIKWRSRDTIVYNARRDPAKPRYARVPTGETTCAFCTMLASRGFVYKSDEMAGMTTDFHTKCDCQIVPEFGKGSAHIEGYDPDALYEMYEKAEEYAFKQMKSKGKTGTPGPGDIATQMRRLYPHRVTDGARSEIHRFDLSTWKRATVYKHDSFLGWEDKYGRYRGPVKLRTFKEHFARAAPADNPLEHLDYDHEINTAKKLLANGLDFRSVRKYKKGTTADGVLANYERSIELKSSRNPSVLSAVDNIVSGTRQSRMVVYECRSGIDKNSALSITKQSLERAGQGLDRLIVFYGEEGDCLVWQR